MIKVPELRRAREQSALTQEELARAAKVSRATVVRLEANGDCFPATLRNLAAALGVEPRELMKDV